MKIQYGLRKIILLIDFVLKGRSSRKLQQEYPELERRYWCKHFWAIGYGAWSTGNIVRQHGRKTSGTSSDSTKYRSWEYDIGIGILFLTKPLYFQCRVV